MSGIDDKSTFARSNGKAAVASRTVWTLTMGGTGIRCLQDQHDPKLYLVEIRTDAGWKPSNVTGPHPGHLLRQVASSTVVVKAFEPHG